MTAGTPRSSVFVERGGEHQDRQRLANPGNHLEVLTMRQMTKLSAISMLTLVAGCGGQAITDETSDEISLTQGSDGSRDPVLLDPSADSPAPKIVAIDPLTGSIMSIRDATNSQPTIAISNPCASGAGCWVTTRAPYANYGFSGTGTASGTWPARGSFYTHNHRSSVCWTYGGNSPCSPTFGPNTAITFSGASVTGKKVTNHS